MIRKAILHPACRILLLLVVLSCGKEEEVPPAPAAHVAFTVQHTVDGSPLVMNDSLYENTAGNRYRVTDLMYFISDITLYPHEGKQTVIREWKDIFYIDEEIPGTLTIRPPDRIPPGSYDSVSLVFGITGEKNHSFMFVNPPEVLMGWPEVLGGGYHYMMMNGNWKDTAGVAQPFNFHLGIGQLYHGTGYDVDSIYAFVQNWFRVSLPGSSFSAADGDTVRFRLTMNINEWFRDPHVYDHNHFGGAIMQNQEAMQTARQNGWNAFSITRE